MSAEHMLRYASRETLSNRDTAKLHSFMHEEKSGETIEFGEDVAFDSSMHAILAWPRPSDPICF